MSLRDKLKRDIADAALNPAVPDACSDALAKLEGAK